MNGRETIREHRTETKNAPTAAEQLLMQAELILEHDKRLHGLEEKLRVLTDLHMNLAERISGLEGLGEPNTFEEQDASAIGDYFTVLAYANMTDREICSMVANILEKRACGLSEEMGYPVRTAHDVQNGEFIAFHEDVLDEVFEELL